MSSSSTVVFSIVLLLSAGAAAGGEDEVCYGELGCFSLLKPWSSITRLNFPSPQSPEKIGTSFQFFTRKRPDGTWVMTWPLIDLTGSDYDGSRWTIFIVHGFGGSITDNWMHDMKDAFLQKMDANVILVGWSAGSKVPFYSQAASNTRVVGAVMARLGRYLITERGASRKRFHLIGHSLGGHTAAYMAKRIPGVARLTGLDVAHIYFANEKPAMRFHRSDAMFVEAIHTDAKPVFPFMGMALYQPVGHVDFYMNGGWDQPGCQFSTNDILRGHVDEGFEDVVDVVFKRNASLSNRKRSPDSQVMNVMRSLFWQILCPHFRSCLYYTEAIRNENCTFWGRARSSTSTILSILSRGSLSKELISPTDCSLKSCTPLGLHTPDYPARGSFHVATSKSPPFCIKESAVDKLMTQEMNSYKKYSKTS